MPDPAPDLGAAPDYAALFDQRGGAYDRAMRRHPAARAAEFAQAIAAARAAPGMTVADVPAGGGYLRAFLPAGCRWLGHEPSGGFANHGAGDAPGGLPLLPLPWADAAVDAAISLAGVHHLADKRPLFAELARVVRPGGRFVLSDVAAGSAEACFLDGFVGAFNSTGHEGAYLDAATTADMRAAGWHVKSSGIARFHWHFPDSAAMADFCHGLFDIRHATPDAVAQAIAAGPGTDPLPGGGIGMRWSLMTIVGVR